jgi:hypothetical protein
MQSAIVFGEWSIDRRATKGFLFKQANSTAPDEPARRCAR